MQSSVSGIGGLYLGGTIPGILYANGLPHPASHLGQARERRRYGTVSRNARISRKTSASLLRKM